MVNYSQTKNLEMVKIGLDKLEVEVDPTYTYHKDYVLYILICRLTPSCVSIKTKICCNFNSYE